ncbi:MAG: DUF87 domain-containing protein [Ignavibacteriota bacterium]
MKLRIAPNFTLPPEAVTETFAILGIRGSGKTNTGVVLTEELLKAGQQVVIVDPVDVWWGLKSSKDGKRHGFALPVIGGDHADIPLDGAAGTVLADFVTDSRASLILSLRNLSMNDQRKFAGDFAKRLYERKGQQRSPLMLMVDEADEFVPQRLPHGHEAMFGAFDRLVRRGRSSGIGVTLISQRAQVINKDVLSQMGTLVCMRVLHKLDRKALEAWIEAHDTEGRQDEFMASLASLGRGDAWIWSPSWLSVFERIHVRERETYDSSTTPKAGDKVTAPKGLAPVDLEQLRLSMAATIERQKADDPKALRARIVELSAKIGQLEKKAQAAAPAMTAEHESAIRKEAARSAHERYMEPLRDAALALGEMRSAGEKLYAALEMAHNVAKFIDVITEPKRAAPPPLRRIDPPRIKPDRPASPDASTNGSMPRPQQRILDGLAWLESIRLNSGSRNIVAFLAEASPKSSAFMNNLGALRGAGLIDYPASGEVCLTDTGRSQASADDAPLTSEELHVRIYDRLPEPQCRILRALIRHRGSSLSREELAKEAGASPASSAYMNNLGSLRGLGLIGYPSQGQVRAENILFLDT